MVSVVVPAYQSGKAVSVVNEYGSIVTMRSTPPQITYSDVAQFGEVEREGRKALTRKTAQGLRRLSFTQLVASVDWQDSIEREIRWFTDWASVGCKVRFAGGSGSYESPCWWHIRDLQVNVTQRASNNEPSRAELSWTLVEAIDVTINIAKVSPPPPPPPPVKKPVYRQYRVVSGDCLWYIAQRFLGNGARWPEIYNLNKGVIGGNPNLIYPGQLYNIPG